ncbi:nucleoside phosphatase GDA1/CD39 [Pelagophyceae sp. CCMP2097]|nr:nucleoside phosphatase GDA1/CD39 [Pelagophyceae sp. CCMP2097]
MNTLARAKLFARRSPLSAIALSTCACLLALSAVLGSSAPGTPAESVRLESSKPWKYIVIVDAGSSGCRAHVFKWRELSSGLRGHNAAVEVDATHNSFKVKPGLSSFATNTAAAGPSLAPMLEFVDKEVPEAERAATAIFLKATAGLRMTAPAARDSILASVRGTLTASAYKFVDDQAMVIDGVDEGGFGWMSVNYLLGNLQAGQSKGSVTVVEMGGASAQVTQLSQAPSRATGPAQSKLPTGYEFDFDLGDQHFDLYTHSYLGFGLEQAREALSAKAAAGNDPCLQRGFAANGADKRASVYDGKAGVDVKGGASGKDCAAAVESHVFADKLAAKCNVVPCSFNGVFQPAYVTASPLLIFENFFYTAKMLGIAADGTATPNDFFKAGDEVCGLEWLALAEAFPKDGSDKAELSKLCFSAQYLGLFLTKGLGVGADTKIRVQQAVGDHGIDWSLGAALLEAARIASGAR